jgi:hypothetical protein
LYSSLFHAFKYCCNIVARTVLRVGNVKLQPLTARTYFLFPFSLSLAIFTHHHLFSSGYSTFFYKCAFRQRNAAVQSPRGKSLRQSESSGRGIAKRGFRLFRQQCWSSSTAPLSLASIFLIHCRAAAIIIITIITIIIITIIIIDIIRIRIDSGDAAGSALGVP